MKTVVKIQLFTPINRTRLDFKIIYILYIYTTSSDGVIVKCKIGYDTFALKNNTQTQLNDIKS